MNKPQMKTIQYLDLDDLLEFLSDFGVSRLIVRDLLRNIYDYYGDDSYLWLEYSDVDDYMDKNPCKYEPLNDFVIELKKHYPETVDAGGVHIN